MSSEKSSPEIEAAIAKIRKLMSYANDGSASEGEIENAMGHARKLMQRFNIEEKEVLLSDDKNVQQQMYESIQQKDCYQRAGQVDPFDQILAAAAALIGDCGVFVKNTIIKNARGHLSNGQIIVFYGMPRDIAVTSALYKELLATMRAMVKFRYDENWNQFYRSYSQGFSDRIYSRAFALKNAPPESSADATTCTAIILRKDAMLDKWKQNNLVLSEPKETRRKKVNADAYYDGSADGRRVDLNTNQMRQS